MNKQVALIFAALIGCSMFTPKDAKTVLDVAKITCLLASPIVDRAEIYKVCDVLASERKAVDNLLDGKAAVARVGLCKSQDAGVE